jgi:dienelactone hydrolase
VEPRATPSAIADAFAALKLLAAHPKIDPKRISIAGFSFGGDIAHITSFERTRAVMSREHRFAAHIAFYPGWTFGAPPGAAAYSGAPVLLLFAEHDELTPSKVKQYLDFLEIYGTKAPLEIITYAGAYHAWANPRLKPTKYYPQHTSMRKCPMILIHAGRANILTEHGEMSMDRALLEKCRAAGRGYTMGFNAQIRAKSIADTIAFLRKHLGE